jgi:uncharacterized membrane protein YgcG
MADSKSTTSQSELFTFGQSIPTFARGYQFALNLGFPEGVSVNNSRLGLNATPDEKIYTMLCESMTLPQRTFDVEEIMVQYGKPPIKITRQVRYTNWSVTFRSPAGMGFRDLFLDWQKRIQDTGEATSKKGRAMDYSLPQDYKVDSCEAKIKLKPGSDSSATGVTYKFYGLFPQDVNGVTLAHSDTGIVTFSVEFAYDFYDIIFNNADGDDVETGGTSSGSGGTSSGSGGTSSGRTIVRFG